MQAASGSCPEETEEDFLSKVFSVFPPCYLDCTPSQHSQTFDQGAAGHYYGSELEFGRLEGVLFDQDYYDVYDWLEASQALCLFPLLGRVTAQNVSSASQALRLFVRVFHSNRLSFANCECERERIFSQPGFTFTFQGRFFNLLAAETFVHVERLRNHHLQVKIIASFQQRVGVYFQAEISANKDQLLENYSPLPAHEHIF